MEKNSQEKLMDTKKALFHSKGITYFDKKTERNFFFVLTIMMLLWGIFAKFGFLTG
ncbi:MAG: hypothetical protein J7M30_01645 [Deltaproteobacteria bacterium]|nr:hypothetical protein [Deltaproteobacteria bacterium]